MTTTTAMIDDIRSAARRSAARTATVEELRAAIEAARVDLDAAECALADALDAADSAGTEEAYRELAELVHDPEVAADATADETRAYRSVAEISAVHRRNGGFWFTPDAMDFFDSKTYGSVHHGRYFISSERYNDQPRQYKVRSLDRAGRLTTVSVNAEKPETFRTYKAAWDWLDRQIERGTLLSYGPSVVDARKMRGEK